MQYHIQTAPVWDAYRNEKSCPLCAIRNAKEKRLVKSYLNENVMDPDFRQRSNALGFCSEHTRMLYAGENKLGLALQLETRAAFIKDIASAPPVDKKSAKKIAQKLHSHVGCVICAELDSFMPRYYMTLAQMFDNEPDFPELFGSAHHCFEHVIELSERAEYAGKSAARFLASLFGRLRSDMSDTESALRNFADCFDHKSSCRPDPDAIPDAIDLLVGKRQ